MFKFINFWMLLFSLLLPYKSHKLDFRTEECLFLGYSHFHEGCKCLSSSGHVFFSKHVLFDEHWFPYSELFPKSPNTVIDVGQYFTLNPNLSRPQLSINLVSNNSISSASELTPHVSHSSSSSCGSMSLVSISPTPVLNTHPMQTRSKFVFLNIEFIHLCFCLLLSPLRNKLCC